MATQEELKAEWAELAAAWIREAREGPNPTRTGLLDGPVLSACGDVRDLSVLDCGCGEGRFSRILAERGASRVLGVDLCPAMVAAARELEGECDEYLLADVQQLDALDSESFDLAVSYLNQCDLPDFLANTREIFRLLRPGGRFVVANLHPMRSAVGRWHRADSGEKRHVIVDRYFDESERQWTMMGTDITNYHRSLTTYMRGFLATGFVLTDLIEPTVNREHLEQHPGLSDELRVPNFIVYALSKPNSVGQSPIQ